LKFGIVFRPVFIGSTLAVSGSEFTTLYIVIIFRQTFEGLVLGSRLATFPWPPSKQMTPCIFGFADWLSTLIFIAIGLGVRKTYLPQGRTALIVNGVFDSIFARNLIYVGLVELIAHEFLFTTSMREGPIRKVLVAFLLLCLGAALMALLGKWA
jgi:zinc transporter 1/2/3